MNLLTDSQRKTYQFIVEYIKEHDYSPKLPEIARGIGIKSTGVVHRYIEALVSANLLEITPRKHRGIRLINPEEAGVSSGGRSTKRIPLLGRIAAGVPILAQSENKFIDFDHWLNSKELFALKVQGNSMIDAGINDGDVVVCEARETSKNGDIVVALIDNEEATLKRINNLNNGFIELLPANAKLNPSRYPESRIKVQGVYVALIKDKGLN